MKKLKIALVKPPQQTNEVQPPLGLGYLASSVQGIADVEIIDSIKDHLNVKNTLCRIRNKNFDIVGIQCYTVDFNTVKAIVESLKNSARKPIIVLGGPHPTLDPVGTLKYIAADYVFLGEAEVSFPIFVKLVKRKKILKESDLKHIPGIAYRSRGGIQTTSPKPPQNLDGYSPSWHLYGMSGFPLAPHGAFCKQGPTAPVIITRGCPFNCTYCGGPKISGRKIRSHSVSYVIRQIELLVKKYGIKEIHIEDDNFTMNRQFVEEFCKKLIDKKFGITWTCPNGVRIDTLDEKLVKLMKDSGLYALSIGIESGSDKIRRLMNKNLSTKTIEEKVKMIKKCGIDVIGFFIVGYPGETEQDINRTIEFSCRLPLTRATFSAFKPFPGTDVYNELVLTKEIKNLDYNKFSLDAIAWSPKGISQQNLKRLRRRAFLRFYFRPGILFKMISEIKGPEHLKFILIRIYRWLLK